MSRLAKAFLVAFIVAYVIMPDAVPGPADDILVTALGVLLNKKLSTN